MLIVNHQESIDISKKKNQAIEIIQWSISEGTNISIWIQPENIESFCLKLMELSKDEVIK